ncbi:hypothetical protein [Micromonospora auratinigra]|uniref:Uncharacterized protein n=1 Tax=Micromonospora auratinigra TaxID=261654 RepID=A0A1A9A884_9ACTN|nr:hypothetical protein [Micromonospora auratinigra]SBT52316.1 hypothetical protein GA0070611_5579 [Micromonospora auratinigra]
MRRSLALLGLPLLLLAGCAAPGAGSAAPAPGGPSAGAWPAFDQRANQVADAWRPGAAWRSGYVPLEDGTVLTGDPGFTEDTKVAFGNGWYRDQIPMPGGAPADGTVRFPDGTLTVPLIGAAAAFAELDKGDPPPCDGRPMEPPRPGPGKPGVGGPTIEPGPDGSGRPGTGGPTIEPGPDGPVGTDTATACVPLTVTGVKLGTATIRTSRGPATVPAWLFTVEELRVPVARVAVAPRAVGAVPEPIAPSGPVPGGVVTVQHLDAVDGARLDYTVGTGACDSAPTPLVLERDDLVVIGAGVTSATGVCTDQLVLKPVRVTLKAPVGTRAVLDVGSGQALVVGRR